MGRSDSPSRQEEMPGDAAPEVVGHDERSTRFWDLDRQAWTNPDRCAGGPDRTIPPRRLWAVGRLAGPASETRAGGYPACGLPLLRAAVASQGRTAHGL